jgi:hypothetical protein
MQLGVVVKSLSICTYASEHHRRRIISRVGGAYDLWPDLWTSKHVYKMKLAKASLKAFQIFTAKIITNYKHVYFKLCT